MPIYFALSASTLHPKVQSIVTEKWNVEDSEAPIEIAPDVFFLGKTGVYKLPSGLRIAVAGGYWDAAKWSESTGREIDTVEVSIIIGTGSDLLKRSLSFASFSTGTYDSLLDILFC